MNIVDLPAELKSALKDTKLLKSFSELSYSKRKEFVRQVNDAKAEDTKSRRIRKIVESLS